MEQVTIYTYKFIEWAAVFGPKLLGASVVFFVGLYLSNLAGKLMYKGFKKRNIDLSLQMFLGSLVNGGIKVLLLITVAGMLGIETTSFVAIIGALGLAVGLALQGSLSNFAGGVLILVFKPFKVGDLIESSGQKGWVQEIQIFNTIVLTVDNRTIILANGLVSNSTIINFSKHGNLRVEINMALALHTNIEFARNVAIETMLSNQYVLPEPAPSFNVTNTANSMITFAVFPYTTPANYWNAYYQVQEDLLIAFNKNGIEGPIPTNITINKNAE